MNNLDEKEIERVNRLKKHFDHLFEVDDTKVIGWFYPPEAYRLFREINNVEDGDKALVALAKDIREHGYYMQGMDYQDNDLVPVFSNFTFTDYTLRGFSAVMAIAIDEDYSTYGYARHMHRAEKPICPKHGYYRLECEQFPLEISESLFNELNNVEIYSSPLSEDEVYLIPFNETNYIHGGDVALSFNNKDKVIFRIFGMTEFNSLDEFNAFIKEKEDVATYHYDKELIKELFNKGKIRFLILDTRLDESDYYL